MFQEYIYFFKFFIICFSITFILLILPLIFVRLNPDSEKLSSYECGFNSFEDARMKFEVRFFLVGILFVIFDLEIAYLYPFAMSLTSTLNCLGFLSIFYFLILLAFGFFYELNKGALDSL